MGMTVDLEQRQADDIQKRLKAIEDQLTFLCNAVQEAREGIAAAAQNPMAKMMFKNFGLGG